jgi:hypothetical protein
LAALVLESKPKIEGLQGLSVPTAESKKPNAEQTGLVARGVAQMVAQRVQRTQLEPESKKPKAVESSYFEGLL